MWVNFLLDKLSDSIDNQLLLFVQSKLHSVFLTLVVLTVRSSHTRLSVHVRKRRYRLAHV